MSRRPLLSLLLAGSALALAPGAAALAQATTPADLILTGGQIYTDNKSWSEALAVSHGAILAVGDAKSIEAFRGPSTQVVDLHGAAVLPGFHDMHIHPISGGRVSMQCPIKRGAQPDEIKAIIAACAARLKPGEWITGRGWTNAVFKGRVQDKTLLDEAAPNNPVLVNDETGHSTWANSLALKIGGVTRDTPSPLNGVIEHDAKGEPSGLLRESASRLVSEHIPNLTEPQKEEALERAAQEILSYGVTSIQDAGGYDASTYDSIAVYARVADKGVKMPRAKVCLRWTYNVTGVDKAFEDLYARRNLYRRANVAPDCVKIGLDGVPGDGHTAAMLEPYAGTKESDTPQYRFGILTTPPEVLKKIVTRMDADGMSVLMHCTGDACARAAVDAIEAARKANGYQGPLHQVGHNNFTTAADLARGRALGATFEYSAYLYYLNPATQTYLTAIGPERFKRYKPLRETIDAGALTLEGSDWPVSASVNPWIAIETLVTRQQPGGGGEPPLAPAERITLKEAVDVYTVNGAKQWGHGDQVGLIRPGYLADLIVLDRNPFAIPITEVHETRVKTAYIGGQVVYAAP